MFDYQSWARGVGPACLDIGIVGPVVAADQGLAELQALLLVLRDFNVGVGTLAGTVLVAANVALGRGRDGQEEQALKEVFSEEQLK